tara:strand:+ start:268 stop:579 length:312 start_codon:yes stop_codon:yes gene_type:complete
MSEDKLKGGNADKLSPKDISDKFKVDVTKINKEIELGVNIELEHTDSKKLAKEITLDHLIELPDYYTRLKKMEQEGENKWGKFNNESIKDYIKQRLRESLIIR